MKKIKKIIRIKAAILAVILTAGSILAAGCGGKADGMKSAETVSGTESGSSKDTDGGTGAKGRYLEKQMATPGDLKQIDNMVKLADGSLAIIDKSSGILYTSSDGAKTWESKEVKAMHDVLAEGGEGIEFGVANVAPDGSMFIAYIDWNISQTQYYIYMDADGNQTQPEFKIESGWLVKAIFTDSGELYGLEAGGTVYELDIETSSMKKVVELQGTGANYMNACGEGILVLDGENAYYYDSKTGETDSSDAVLNEFLAKELALNILGMASHTNGENIYIASASGIYSHVKGGGIMEELLPGGLSSLGNPSMQAAAMAVNDDDSIIIAYANGEIDSYRYDPDISSVPKKQLNIYGLHDNTTVRQAISSYQKENPDVYAKFEIGVSGEDSTTENDAIQSLNTRLLAGDGPDIILLDGMPMNSYMEKGILEDLSGVIKDLKKDSSYYENILDAYSSKDGAYGIPFRFLVPAMLGEQETLGKIKDLKSFAETVKELRAGNQKAPTILGTYNPKELLQMLYLTSSPAWMSDGKFDEGSLKEFLTEAKDIYESEQQNLSDEYRNSHQRSLNFIEESGRDVEQSLLGLESWGMDVLTGYQLIVGGYLRGMDDFQTVSSIAYQTQTIQYQPLTGQESQVFSPNGIVGMNANSGKKDDAEAFIITLLGKTVQGVDLKDGFPVNEEAFDSFSLNPNPSSIIRIGSSDIDGNQVSLELAWPTEEEIQGLKKMIETLKTPTETDYVIRDTILNCGEAALKGDKSIEESVNEIKQKISLYLAE